MTVRHVLAHGSFVCEVMRGLPRAASPCTTSRLAAASAATLLAVGCVAFAQEQSPSRRDVTIVAHESRFEPDRIEVAQNDLVRVTLKSDRLPRTFAIDAYRISKRVAGGESITFEFHARQPGTFSYYCNLTSVPACRDMKGTLVVTAK